MTKKADDILARAKRFYESGDVVNVRTKRGAKYRGCVDKAQATGIRVSYSPTHRRFVGQIQRVTLLPKDIISINFSKAFN